jgi:hypothetical protein
MKVCCISTSRPQVCQIIYNCEMEPADGISMVITTKHGPTTGFQRT